MNNIQMHILEEVAGLHAMPVGAYNIRLDGGSAGRNSTANIEITPKTDKNGIDIRVAAGTKNESVHIPVILSQTGLKDLVYNDFYIGKDADVTIIAGCGIHNSGDGDSQHDGIHTFYLEEGARVKYIEKHYAEGDGTGEKVLNPVTVLNLGKDSYMEMDTVQIKGVDHTDRETKATLGDGASVVISEKLMTYGQQRAVTSFEVNLDGAGSSANVMSRSVAKGDSRQAFLSKMFGNNKCAGHSECDAIIMDASSVTAIPEVTANHIDASLIHEAAIGKIAGEQIIKLMTLGLTEEEAEGQIVDGFLK